ncbi:MAG: lysophospholipid acyltransferase family protein [Candidatus Lokiarchaeota archaeon]|nr:lysophospholipid acyltransferase family protein [Candidatus Lokiarchaeota archaeon]
MEKHEDFIPKSSLIEVFGLKPWLATIVMQLMKINKLNRFHKNKLVPYNDYPEMYRKALEKLNITVNFDTSFLHELKNQAFCTVSNHAFGFLDGTILLGYIGKERPIFKFTGNYILQKIKASKDYVIPVNPFDERGKPKGMGGTNVALEWLENGNVIGFFPAGEVATYYEGSKEITDRPWKKGVFKLIRMAQVPIVPIYFEGTNSRIFHILGRIHTYVRTFLLIKEYFKKRGETISVRVGGIVYPETYNQYASDEEMRDFFRKTVYSLKRKKK